MHQKYLNDGSPTDIMTFDLTEEGQDLDAELYISSYRAKEHAERFNLSWENELARLIIHGLLHLAGFDDQTEADYRRMKSEEERLLKMLFKK